MTAMQLKNIIKDTTELIRASEQLAISYQEKKIKDGELIAQDLKGVQQVRNELEEMQAKFKEEAHVLRKNLEDRIDEWVGLVETITEEDHKSVTQDELAELTLLGMLDVSLDEINNYATKYRNNPLALRLIRKIAGEREMMITVPMTRAEKAKEVASKMKMDIQYHSQPKPKLPKAHITMVADGDASRLQQLLIEYTDLEKEIKKS